ncbi:DNA invertase [Minicystis rosea]|nr:DNA invertase [Minicystis rosea]
MRVALYARVSSERQAQQETIDSQLVALRQRATAQGCALLPDDEYVDDGYSGATLARPALERLRDRIAEGVVDRLYIDCPDRLSRRYAYQVLLLEEFKARGVEVVFLQRASGQSAEDTLLIQVQGMLAEYERARLAERCRRGKLHQARSGKVNPLSSAPYGYRYVRRSDAAPASFDVELSEAKVVREIFDAFVHQQRSLYAIAHALEERGIPTRKGAHWAASTLYAMLKNPAYAGKAAYGKTEVTEAEPRPAARSRRASSRPFRAHRRTSPKRWISIEVPALVSTELFSAAQEQLARNQQQSLRRAPPQTFLLQGLVRCALCGHAFCGRTSKDPKRGATHRYYACRHPAALRQGIARACTNPTVRAEELDAQVWSSVCQVLQEPERLEHEWRCRMEADGTMVDARAEQARAQRWLAAQERIHQRLLDAYEAGALSLEELTARVPRIRERLQRAQEMVQAADAAVAETTVLHAVVGRLQDFSQHVREGLERLDWSARQHLIRTLVSRVELDEEKVTVIYRLPPPGRGPAPAEQEGSAVGAICRLSLRRQDAKTQKVKRLNLPPAFLHLCAPAPCVPSLAPIEPALRASATSLVSPAPFCVFATLRLCVPSLSDLASSGRATLRGRSITRDRTRRGCGRR